MNWIRKVRELASVFVNLVADPRKNKVAKIKLDYLNR